MRNVEMDIRFWCALKPYGFMMYRGSSRRAPSRPPTSITQTTSTLQLRMWFAMCVAARSRASRSSRSSAPRREPNGARRVSTGAAGAMLAAIHVLIFLPPPHKLSFQRRKFESRRRAELTFLCDCVSRALACGLVYRERSLSLLITY